MLVDLDIVNPFFRSAEVKPLLVEHGVEIVYPAYALSGVDIPILPAEVERAFTTDGFSVFDVGGDDDGAVALGRYHAQFAACPADVYFVVNPFRPRTAEVAQALRLMEAVERRALPSRVWPSTPISARRPRRRNFWRDGRSLSALRRKAACRWRSRRGWRARWKICRNGGRACPSAAISPRNG